MGRHFVTFHVDPQVYRRRVTRVYRKPSQELMSLVVNLVYHQYLIVPRTQQVYRHSDISHRRVLRALNRLMADGFLQEEVRGRHGVTTIYSRTPLFEETFRFRKLPPRIVVLPSALRRESLPPTTDPNTVDIAAVPGLQTYSRLVQPVKLSLATGDQVFEDVVLRRVSNRRLYQVGIHNYQTIPRHQRKQHLLMDGRPTLEVDYVSMHPTMLLNMSGRPSPREDIYSSLLRDLGLPVTEALRDAMKMVFLIAINIPTVSGFCSYLGRDCDAYRQHLRGRVRPRDIYNAIVDRYPGLQPLVCTGKRQSLLQQRESEIMIDVLEALARMGIVALPEHDSVVCHPEHRITVAEVMQDVYRQHMGFSIQVK